MTICSTKGEKKRKLSSISAGWGDASRRGRNDRRNAEHCAVNEHAFRCGAGRTPPSGSGPGGMDPACGRRTGRNARGPSSTRKPACGKRRQCLLQGRGFRSFPKVLRRASLAEISAAPFLRPAAPAGKRLERLPPLDRVARCRSPRIPPLPGENHRNVLPLPVRGLPFLRGKSITARPHVPPRGKSIMVRAHVPPSRAERPGTQGAELSWHPPCHGRKK